LLTGEFSDAILGIEGLEIFFTGIFGGDKNLV